ncbi:MAG: hybrid sensor histidine kinase/response regulator, partial [Bacteroidota bacterium]
GNREIGEIINAINHGKIYHFITKPWKVDELKLIMDKALEYYNLKCHNQELIHSLENKNLQLTRAIEELELFLYRSSHDLRGPLATQMGLIRLTRMESGIEHVEEYLSRLEECTYNLASTLDKFSKVNVFNIDEVHFHEVNVNQLLEEIIGNQQHKIEERSISIKVNCKGENKFISNSELVRIVIENLIENAIKFSDSDKENGPFIEIDALQTPSQLTLEFRDNGIGIEDQHMPRIFDPFFKVNRGWGNGLGLYVVQKVLHKLGGTIDFSSEFQKGTSVKLTLPNATMGEAKLRFAC